MKNHPNKTQATDRTNRPRPSSPSRRSSAQRGLLEKEAEKLLEGLANTK
jgi:hypothetical protein